VPGLVGNVGQAAGLITALVSLTAAVAGSAAAADFTLTIPHGGLTRTALVHVPAGAGEPRPDANEEMWRFFERFARR
jgi:poly(3-hydroxybutyrate) depolymerase